MKSQIRTHVLWGTILAVGFCLSSQIHGQGRQDVQLSSGDPISGGNVTFLSFPSLNNSGSIAIRGSIDGQGVFLMKAGGTVSELIRVGDTIAGGSTISSIANITRINDNNAVSFAADIDASADTGIFLYANSVISEIVREGDMVPFGGNFDILPAFQSHGLSRNGQDCVAFASILTNTDADNGAFRGRVGNIFTLAREDQSAPNGGTFLTPSRVVVEDVNRIAFSAGVSGGPGGIFFFNGAINQQLAANGGVAPDGNGNYNALPINGFGLSKPNILGQVAFTASLNGTAGGSADDQGIFIANTFQSNVVARKGQAAPGSSGLSFGTFYTPRLNDSEEVAFAAALDGAQAGESSGLYVCRNGVVSKLVREDEVAPGQNGKFGSLVSDDSRSVEINEAGVVLFQTNLESTDENFDYGIFLTNGDDTVKVAQKGDSLLGSTITTLQATTGNFGTTGSSFNDRNQVAYRAVLEDGRRVIVLFTPTARWTGGSTGIWAAPGNWTLDAVPSEINDVRIDPDFDANVSGPGLETDTSVASLQIGGGAGDVTFNWPLGFLLDAGTELTIADGSELAGGGFVIADSLFNEGLIAPTDAMTINAEEMQNLGTIVTEGSLTLSGELLNASQITVPNNSGVALIVLGELIQNGNLDVGSGSEAIVDCLLGSGGGSGLGTITVRESLQPGGQDTANLSYSTLDFVLQETATTEIQIGGVELGEFDRVFARTIVLDGELNVSLVPSFELQPGMEFAIASAFTSNSGEFDNLADGDMVGVFDGLELRID